MANDKLLDLCTSSTTLGNGIAVHMLDYLSTVKTTPYGFKELASEFLDTSRVLIASKSGLAETVRARSQLAANVAKELQERLRQVNSAFSVLNQVVNRCKSFTLRCFRREYVAAS